MSNNLTVNNTVNNETFSELAVTTLTTVGNNVIFIRKSLLNLKLNQMAELTGVSRDVLCRLEALASGDIKRRVYPSFQTLIKFCETLGLTLVDILSKDIRETPALQKTIAVTCYNEIERIRNEVTATDEE